MAKHTPVPFGPGARAIAPSSRPLSLPWQVASAVVLCVLVIAALDIGYLSMSSTQSAMRERLERNAASVVALERLQAIMVDAETGVRGYALVGRDDMLEPYWDARARYTDALADVEALTKDDPTQAKNLEVLRGLIEDKWKILGSTVELVDSRGGGRPAATEGTQDTPGKVIMDAIRAQVNVMRNRQASIGDQIAADAQRATFYTRLVVIFASALALLAIAALCWAIWHYLNLRRTAEQELRASEERYRILTEVSPQIVWMADAKGEMTFCNRQWVDYTGLTLEQTAAAGATSVVHPDDRKEVIAGWRHAVSRDDPFDAEVRLRRGKDSVYRWHLARARPLHDNAGKTLAWLGAAVDIDDRKMTEIALDEFNTTLAEQVAERTATLEERTAQLKALNRHLITVAENERSRLARELHDEIGAHLSVAMMDLTVISRRLAEAELGEISALAHRLSETLGATTQISRRIISDLRPVMIRDLGLLDALDAYCAQFEQTTSIQCERVFPAQLPSMVEEASIALFRVVQESLSNVVKYAKASRVRLTVTVAEGFLALSIQDDGSGMGNAVFATNGGHGLLGIRERAEAFGGELHVASGLDGRGTGVFVTLALAQIAAPPPASASAAPAPTAIAR